MYWVEFIFLFYMGCWKVCSVIGGWEERIIVKFILFKIKMWSVWKKFISNWIIFIIKVNNFFVYWIDREKESIVSCVMGVVGFKFG